MIINSIFLFQNLKRSYKLLRKMSFRILRRSNSQKQQHNCLQILISSPPLEKMVIKRLLMHPNNKHKVIRVTILLLHTFQQEIALVLVSIEVLTLVLGIVVLTFRKIRIMSLLVSSPFFQTQ